MAAVTAAMMMVATAEAWSAHLDDKTQIAINAISKTAISSLINAFKMNCAVRTNEGGTFILIQTLLNFFCIFAPIGYNIPNDLDLLFRLEFRGRVLKGVEDGADGGILHHIEPVLIPKTLGHYPLVRGKGNGSGLGTGLHLYVTNGAGGGIG